MSRKRQEVESESNQSEDSDSGSESGELDAQEIFRRHFEAQFEALPQVVKPVVEDSEISGDSDQEDDEDEEWAGISGEEEDSVVVVQHTTTGAGSLGMTREELKAFMVCCGRFATVIHELTCTVEPQTTKLNYETCRSPRQIDTRGRRCIGISKPQERFSPAEASHRISPPGVFYQSGSSRQ